MVESDPHARCVRCGGLLEIEHRVPRMAPEELLRRFTERRGAPRDGSASGVWRYKDIVLPSATEVVSHPEGNTPLLQRSSIDRWAGVDGLLLKHEGHNPTGSFKDRGMTVGVTQARRIGARAVACASTGNTSASLAAYASLAGIPALVLVPAGNVALGKLAQSLAYGAKTLLVRGDFDDCLRLVEEASERLGVYLLNSINPFRLEGQKTIVLEALEQLGWDPPDWIVLPAGNLGNTVGVRQGARRGARVGAHRPAAATGGRAGGGGRAVRAELRRGLRAAASGEGRDRRDRDPDRRSRVLRPRGQVDSGDERRGARGERRGDPRGKGGGRRVGRRLRAGQRRERGRRQAASSRRARFGRPTGSSRCSRGTFSRTRAPCCTITGRWIRRPTGANRPIEIEPTIDDVARVLEDVGPC